MQSLLVGTGFRANDAIVLLPLLIFWNLEPHLNRKVMVAQVKVLRSRQVQLTLIVEISHRPTSYSFWNASNKICRFSCTVIERPIDASASVI